MRVSDVSRHEEQPDERRHRLAAAMLEAFEQHPEQGQDARAIAFVTVDQGDKHAGSTATCGYDTDADAAADLLAHLAAMFEANGMRIDLIPMTRPAGQG